MSVATDTIAAARLSRAAAALSAARLPADPTTATRVARMAALDAGQWSSEHIRYAAQTLSGLRADLVRVGVDPSLLPLPAPTPAAGPAAGVRPTSRPAQPAAPEHPEEIVPFDYEHTIDGLRGIPVTDLPHIAERRAKAFNDAGITTVYDLLMHVPLRYVHRTEQVPMSRLTSGEKVTVLGHVVRTTTDTTRTGQRIARIILNDGTGTMSATYFNAPWQAARFNTGDEVVALGIVDSWTNPNTGHVSYSMVNPLLDRTGTATADVIPIYPQSGKTGLTTWMIHRAVQAALARIGHLDDPIPEHLTRARNLLPRVEALQAVHTPSKPGQDEPGRERLAYDELLRMQVGLGLRRNTTRQHAAVTHQPTGALVTEFRAALPFPLTGAQERATQEITADLAAPHPMNRLLQGDVGSGKTCVAAIGLLSAIESGHQGALMAPTAILATQHYEEIAALLAGLTHPSGRPLRVDALTNNVRSKARKDTLAALAAGECDLVVGTHSLLSNEVEFQSLGLVVVDEQHRFGVEQRAALRDKAPGGARADMLAATATPIPRTAAMTVFGDLDVTVLDELPPGRTPIRTTWIDTDVDLTNPTADPWGQVRDQVAQGRQAYVVCPLVTKSESMQAASAQETLDALSDGALTGLRIGLVHGKQKPAERAQIMDAFSAGDMDVLVATTVIEVGVNVPNATTIVILDPMRFGIAQLHQLRGRVGRGQHASECHLYGPASSGDGARRMQALVDSTDGFVLSQTDLDIRGMGTVFGSQQAGQGDLRVASLETDTALLAAARQDATAILENDPLLGRFPTLRAEIMGALGPQGQDWLERG